MKHTFNGYYNLMQKAVSFDDVARVSVIGSDYRIHFWYMSKDDATNIIENSNLNVIFPFYKKMSDKNTY